MPFKFDFVILELAMFVFNVVICVHCRDHLYTYCRFFPFTLFPYQFMFVP